MSTKVNILIIEDDKSINTYISTALNINEYHVTTASTGREGLSLAASLCPNVILLDLGLPDMDGCEVLRQLRIWTQTPVIIISARDQEEDKVTALDMGADDYISKPFSTGELMARIRTALRHSSHTSERIYKSLDLEINFDKRLVLLCGREIHLTQVEYQLLSLRPK